MSRVKDFGFRIAQMLFESKMSVNQVVDYLSTQITEDKNGKLITVEVDKEWLRSQVLAVKNSPNTWGYSYQTPYQKRIHITSPHPEGD